MRLLRPLLCAAAIAALVAPAITAQDWNDKKTTYLTFSGPIQVPGATLPAGTYMFRVADPSGNARKIIQIRDKEGTRIFATLFSVPNQMPQPKDDPFVMFSETPAGQPVAVKSWFYPGERTGYEFVYPKDQVMRIARDTKTSVLALADNRSGSDIVALSDSKVGRFDEQGQFAEEGQAATTAAPAATATETPATSSNTPAETATTTTPSGTPSASAEEPARTVDSSQTPTAASGNLTEPGAVGTTGQASTEQRPARELPRTASDRALVQLLSGLSLVAAFALRQRRKSAASSHV